MLIFFTHGYVAHEALPGILSTWDLRMKWDVLNRLWRTSNYQQVNASYARAVAPMDATNLSHWRRSLWLYRHALCFIE